MQAIYTQCTADNNPFREADEKYASIKRALLSKEFGSMEGADIERWAWAQQKELIRCMVQVHYDQRGRNDVGESVIGSDGLERPYVRQSERQVETLFGTVFFERKGYAGADCDTRFPVDASLNLPPRKYSLEIERRLAQLSSKLSFDETIDLLEELSGAHVPKRQAVEAVRRAAFDFETFYEDTCIDRSEPTSDLLILTFDQKGIVLLPDDLKEATQKAAKKGSRKLQTRCSKGEPKRGRKRMSSVAAVYTIAPHCRSAEEVIAGLCRVRAVKEDTRPRPENKRVWASVTRELNKVISEAFEEALKRDPTKHKKWLVLIDGDDKLLQGVTREAKRLGVEITPILDFIHALEYLWKAGRAFFDEGSKELEEWVLGKLKSLLDGRVSYAVAGMTRMATLRKLTPKERKPVDQAGKYMLTRKKMMRYDEFLTMGAPIATGVIEGACRHLINDRMNLTGARWRLPTAEAVLCLRSLISSGDFDAYWEYHEKKELERNHLAKYANQKIPRIVRSQRKANLRLIQ